MNAAVAECMKPSSCERPTRPSLVFCFEQAGCGAQRLLEQRRSDGDILQLDNFDIGDLHWGPPLLIWLARPRVHAQEFPGRPYSGAYYTDRRAIGKNESPKKFFVTRVLFRRSAEPAFAIINFLLFPPGVFRAGSTLSY